MLATEQGSEFVQRFPCHQLNGSFDALPALRKTVQWANQEVFEANENAEPIAFFVLRRSKLDALCPRCDQHLRMGWHWRLPMAMDDE